MPRAGFYNDNEYRAYPFVFKSAYSSAKELPPTAIVDCGFIMGLDSGFDAAIHSVYLASVTRTASTLEFVFETDAPGAAAYPITFMYDIDAEEWQTNFDDSAPNVDDNFCAEEPAWEGFMVVGVLSELLELMPTPETIAFYVPEEITLTDTPDYLVEPARLQSLVRGYVRSISVANYARPMVPECQPAAGSSSSSSSATSERQILINAQCIKGDIQVKAGYNCAIRQNAPDRSITVSAFRRDAGTNDSAAEICQYGSELPLYPGHVPPDGGVFLTGGPACNDLITSINGIAGPNVTINADPGIQIVSDGDNSIKIDVTPNIVQQDCG